MDLVSVIVPVYNVKDYLDRCVESVIKQTYQNIELLLVDDGSNDGSGEMCDSWAVRDSRIRAFHKENGGLADARNYGITKARGTYVEFLDSDDYIEKDTIRICMEKLKQYDSIDIVCFGMTIEYEHGTSIIKQTGKQRVLSNWEALIELNSYKNIEVSACNKFFSRKLFDTVRFPKGKLCEDYYIMHKLFSNSRQMLILPDNLYHYWQRENSITHNKTFNMDYIYASQEQLAFIRKEFPDLEYIGITNYLFALVNLYNFYLIYPDSAEIEGYTKTDIVSQLKKNQSVIYGNRFLPIIKKIQLFVMINMKKAYVFVFERKYKRIAGA